MCEGHKRCTWHPIYRVTMHRLDQCNKPPSPDYVNDLCSACARAVAYCLQEALDEWSGEPKRCKTCGRVVGALHDLFTLEYIHESESA